MAHSTSIRQDNAFLRRLARRWREWRNRRATVSDLDRCGPDEVERVARDAGVSSSELRILAGKWPDAGNLLGRRMEHLKLDMTRAEPRVMQDLQRSCTLCRSKRQCERDLSSDPCDPVWQGYCPNEFTLAALAAERARNEVR